MQRTDLIAFANAKAALERIEELNQAFLAHAKSHASPYDVPSSLQVLGNDLAIDCFGTVATAKPRPVRAPNDLYCMEYVFTVPHDDRMLEITRFYLSPNGLILDAPTAQQSVCDFNNTQIARHLCGRALIGFLASPVLAPASSRR